MITGADIQQLKDYVAGADAGGQRQAESTVRIHVTHSNLKAKFVEIRLDMHMSVASVKSKLSSHCGTAPEDMTLHLKDDRGAIMACLSDDNKLLGYYSPYDGCELHILDANPHSLSANGWLEDTTKVKKYVMSDEDYDKRENTYRSHKAQMQKVDPEWTSEKELCLRRGIPYSPPTPKIEDDDHMEDEASCIPVGSRCEVDPGAKRGKVRYVGRCQGLPKGFWVGVQYDEPVGKNDGSVKGERYFQCNEGYGGFLRPNLVRVGDFPPVDEFEFSDGDEI